MAATNATNTDDFKNWLSSMLAEERQQLCAIFETRHKLLMEGVEQRLLGDAGQNTSRQDPGCEEANAQLNPSEGPLNQQMHASQEIVAVPDHTSKMTRQEEEQKYHSGTEPEGAGGEVGGGGGVGREGKAGGGGGRGENAFTSNLANIQEVEEEEQVIKSKRYRFIYLPDTFQFEITFGMVILINTVVICMELQYTGADIGYKLGYADFMQPSSETYPGFEGFDTALNVICNVLFTIEIILRLAFTKQVWKSLWIWLDILVVPIAWLELLQVVEVNTSIIRVFRLARTVRVVKIIHTMSAFRVLFFMIRSVVAGLGPLFWSFVLGGAIQTCAGMFLCQMLTGYLRDESIMLEHRQEVFRIFGTFSHTLFTMYEISDGNWVKPARVLMDHVDPWWGWFVLLYRCVLFFAFGKVIAAVFITETQRLIAQDVQLQAKQAKSKAAAFQKAVYEFFRKIDKDNDNIITKAELKAVAKMPEVTVFAQHLDLDASHLVDLIEVLDTGDGNIDLDEFVKGIPKLKGNASSIEMSAAIHRMRKIASDVKIIKNQILLPKGEGSTSRQFFDI